MAVHVAGLWGRGGMSYSPGCSYEPGLLLRFFFEHFLGFRVYAMGGYFAAFFVSYFHILFVLGTF